METDAKPVFSDTLVERTDVDGSVGAFLAQGEGERSV